MPCRGMLSRVHLALLECCCRTVNSLPARCMLIRIIPVPLCWPCHELGFWFCSWHCTGCARICSSPCSGREQAGSIPVASAGRIPLSPEASCLSFAHFLELSFGAHYLELHGRPLHTQFARYFGLGQLVACFHYEEVECNDVALPPAVLACQTGLQQEWLTIEIDSLIEVSPAFQSSAADSTEPGRVCASSPACVAPSHDCIAYNDHSPTRVTFKSFNGV